MSLRFTKLSSQENSDSDTDSDLKLRISHKRLKTNASHETTEINSIIPTATTIPSKNKRKKINRRANKDKQKAINQEDDEFLRHAAFQIGLDQLPFPHIPVVPAPKPLKPPKVKETITWKAKQSNPKENEKPSKHVKEKRPRTPPFNYVLRKSIPDNVAQNNTFSKPVVDPIDDDDDDEDDDYKYDDYYDGVAEERTIPLVTPFSSTSTTCYEETPLEKVSKIAFPARFIAGRRQV